MLKKWFIHIEEEAIGPLSSDKIILMLQQNRLQFVDYIWCKTFTKWHRVSEVDEFARLLPAYPEIPVPEVSRKEREKEPEAEKEAEVEAEKELEAEMEVKVEKKRELKEELKKTAESIIKKKWPKIRKFPRIGSQEVVATVKDHGDFRILNISEGGVFLESHQPFEIGKEVQFTLYFKAEKKTLEMTGIVVRQGEVAGKKGFALQYRRLNPAHKNFLENYINQKIAKS